MELAECSMVQQLRAREASTATTTQATAAVASPEEKPLQQLEVPSPRSL